MCKYIVVEPQFMYELQVGLLQSLSITSDIQTCTHTIRQAIYDFLFVFHCNYFSILHRFWDIITYFPKLIDVMWPRPRVLMGQFIISVLKHHMANQYTKFQVSSFSHYGDILEENKNLNVSRDHNDVPFRDDLSSVCWD